MSADNPFQSGNTLPVMTVDEAHAVAEGLLAVDSIHVNWLYRALVRTLSQPRVHTWEHFQQDLKAELEAIYEAKWEARREDAEADLGDSRCKEEREEKAG